MNTTRISIEPKDLVMFRKYIIIESNGKEQCAFFNSLYKDDYCCFSNGDNNDFQYIIIPIEGTTFYKFEGEEEIDVKPSHKIKETPTQPESLTVEKKYLIVKNNGEHLYGFFYKRGAGISSFYVIDYEHHTFDIEEHCGETFYECEDEPTVQPKQKNESNTVHTTVQRPYLQLCGKYIINTNNIFYIKKYDNEYEIVFNNGMELLIKKNQDNESFDAVKAFFNEFIENNKVDL